MIHQSIKSPLALSIGGVGLVASVVIALSYWSQTQQTVSLETASPASEAATTPDIFIPSATDPWERALEFGWEAAVAAQTASSEAEWRRVGDLWLQAIAELEQVPPDSPQRQEAQAKIQAYLANFDYAEEEKAKARAAAPAVTSRLSMAIVKAALADGPMQAEFSSGTSASGNPAIIGQTADGRARMELLGSEENLTQIKLILPGEAGASPVTMANVVYLNHFLGVVLPDGIGQGTWAVDSLNRLEAQPNRPISKDFGPVQVKVSTDASAGGVTVNAASKQ